MTINVLVTGVGGTVGQGVLKALNLEREKFKIIVTDMNPASAGLYLIKLFDKVFCVPPVNQPNYISEIKNIIDNEAIQIIIPTSDPEVQFFAENRNIFPEDRIKIAAPNTETILKFNDKWSSYLNLKNNNIPTPYSILPKPELSLEDKISFPIIVKPRFGASSQGVSIVHSYDELSLALGHVKNPLIQEYIIGKEYTVGTLTDLEGDIIGILPMERELNTGCTFRAVIVKNSDIENAIYSAIEKIGLKGPANFQLRISERTNIPMIFEINTRFSSTTPFQAQAGFNSPVLFCKNLMGEKIKPIKNFKEGLVMLRYWEETYIDTKSLMGPLAISCNQIERESGAVWSDWFKLKE